MRDFEGRTPPDTAEPEIEEGQSGNGKTDPKIKPVIRTLLRPNLGFISGFRQLREAKIEQELMARSALAADQASREPETFDQAVARQGLSEEYLVERAKQLHHLVMFYLFGFACLSVWGLWSLLQSQTFADVVAALAMFAMCAVFGALTMRAGFRQWQIRKRRLGGYNLWLRSPKEWLPY